MWVQLKSIQNLSDHGRPRTYHPGDWVDVGRQQAQLWLARGEAAIPAIQAGGLVNGELGVIVPANLEFARKHLDMYGSHLQVEEAPLCLPFERTVLWDTTAPVQAGFFAVGLALLDKWEIAVPLFDYDILAQSIGDEAERKATKAVIRDLRVPVYDARLIFVRRNPETEALIKEWGEEPGDRRLAFMRALYRRKPFILALPCSWTGHNVPQ
jgi:hypothetical protein